jgi:quercetin dioxygenase-like cupin family protein
MTIGLFWPASVQAAPPSCPVQDITLARGVEIVSVLHTYKGADGESHMETMDLHGETKTFYGGSTKLTQFDLGDPTRVMLVYGFPNIEIAKHPSPYREIFILLSGSSTIIMPDGKTYERRPGDVLIADDQGTPGRSGHAGPCGYVALDLQFKPPTSP